MAESLIDKVTSLAKRRGFVFFGADQGGLSGVWDWGPLGVRLKANVRNAWLRAMLQVRDDVELLDPAILTQHPGDDGLSVGADEREPRLGLRSGLAESTLANFENVRQASRRRVPFGIASTGKVFRKEASAGMLLFRSREFEEMSLLYFVEPGADEDALAYWGRQRLEWYASELCITRERLRLEGTGLEYEFPFGWRPIEGVHCQGSDRRVSYFDEVSGEHVAPCVIEAAAGLDRVVLASLLDAYDEEPDKDGIRVVLRFSKAVAPVQVAVMPLSKRDNLCQLASRLEHELRTTFVTEYDETASIGKRYRRQDEIGTPLCVTVDFQSLDDHAVTIRQRDSMQQQRVPLDGLRGVLRETLENLT